jgi:hypothetical protein
VWVMYGFHARSHVHYTSSFLMARQPLGGLGRLIFRGFTITLLWGAPCSGHSWHDCTDANKLMPKNCNMFSTILPSKPHHVQYIHMLQWHTNTAKQLTQSILQLALSIDYRKIRKSCINCLKKCCLHQFHLCCKHLSSKSSGM